jgi:nucleotide-binding universal stress UspA family protein
MTVVAAVDRSSRGPGVAEEGRRLADAFGDDLHVVHVLGQSEFLELERTSVDDTGQPVPMDEVREVASTIAGEAIEDVAPDATAVGLVGDAPDEIVRYAEDEGVDLIVMSTHGRSGFTRWLMGSVTEKVLRHAPCPVLAMRSETVPSRILITLDGSIIAWQSMKPGLEVARRLQGTVTLLRVVNAVEDLDEVTKGQLKFEGNEELYDLSTTLQQSAMKELQKNAATYGSELPDIEIAVTSGRPAEGILDYAEQHEIDLIVMTTHGRSGLERWEYGSVSEKVVRGAHCSTLVIRAAFS